MARYDKDISEGRIHGKLGLDRDGDIIIKLQADGEDLVFKQYDGYEVARIHDGATDVSVGGGFGYRKRIIDVDDALNLSDVATALPYSGATFSLTQGDSESGFAITLPSAASAEEAIVLVGWHISIIITSSGSASVTVVRGAGGDTLVGTVVAGDAAASGITIGSHVITFVGGTAAEGDRVDITCVATPDRTDWVVQGFCAV